MRFNSLKNAVLRVMIRRATGIVIAFLIAATGWAAPHVEEGVDWVVDRQAKSTGELSISIDTEPTTLVYGDVVDATVDVTNGTNEDGQLVIKVLLGEGAHFVRGDCGVRFEQPDQAENQRQLEWPILYLPAGARGRVSFQFLVTWHTFSRDVYIQVDALDLTKGKTPVVTHLSKAAQFPAGRGGFLEQNGYMLFTVVFGLGLILGVWRAKCRIAGGASIAASLSGICMGIGTVLVVLFTSIIWSEFVPWFGWIETKCNILDVRYALDTRETRLSQGPSSTVYSYSGSLALSFEGPQGTVIASGYRQQSSIRKPEIMNKYRAGSQTVCYYDPNSPDRVIVERDLEIARLMKESAFIALGLLLSWFGYRSSFTSTSIRSADQL